MRTEGNPTVLIDVAAFTSVAMGPVAEAFVMHEITRYSVVQSWIQPSNDILPAESFDIGRLTLPQVYPGPIAGPQPVSRPIEQVEAMSALQGLALLSGPDLSRHMTAHPEEVATLLSSPPPPRSVSLWWSTLGPESRVNLQNIAPQLVGNLEGVPVQVRDVANRTMLDATIHDLHRLIGSDAGRSVVENAKQQLNMLESISTALDPRLGQPAATAPMLLSEPRVSAIASVSLPTGTADAVQAPSRTLLTLDVAGQGRAAIVLGDLSTADYVTYLVPGMFFTIENQMSDWVGAATGVYDQQREWLRYFDSVDGDGAKTVATVAWIGYHTPNLTNVGGIQNANEGRDALASAIKGLQSSRTGNEPYITVIAHSYGSTAALMALTEYDFEIDALALVGSPGSPARLASDLHVKGGNVFVGEAAWDPIPNSSYFGSDPGSASYGAKTMQVTGGADSLTGAPLLASTGHNEYFSPGTESMRNFALIAIGKGQFVSGSSPVVVAKAFAPAK